MTAIWLTLAVAVAGGTGAVLRLFLAQWQTKLPMGILAANIVASLIAGVVIGTYTEIDGNLAPMLIAGLCGGLSTFSSYAAGTVKLALEKQNWLAFLNSLLNFVFPSTAVLFGLAIGAALLN